MELLFSLLLFCFHGTWRIYGLIHSKTCHFLFLGNMETFLGLMAHTYVAFGISYYSMEFGSLFHSFHQSCLLSLFHPLLHITFFSFYFCNETFESTEHANTSLKSSLCLPLLRLFVPIQTFGFDQFLLPRWEWSS